MWLESVEQAIASLDAGAFQNLSRAFLNKKLIDYSCQANGSMVGSVKTTKSHPDCLFIHKNNNRFKAYIFTMNDIDSDEDTKYINVKEKYDKYKNGNKEKITLIASLLLSKDNDEKKEIIESLFSGKIKDIFSHYFL